MRRLKPGKHVHTPDDGRGRDSYAPDGSGLSWFDAMRLDDFSEIEVQIARHRKA